MADRDAETASEADAVLEVDPGVLSAPLHAKVPAMRRVGTAFAKRSRIGGRTLPDRRCYHQRVTLAPRHQYSYSDYLALDEYANVKHEYFDGEIYAMVGGTPEHAAISANVMASLANQLRGRGCQVSPRCSASVCSRPGSPPTPT